VALTPIGNGNGIGSHKSNLIELRKTYHEIFPMLSHTAQPIALAISPITPPMQTLGSMNRWKEARMDAKFLQLSTFTPISTMNLIGSPGLIPMQGTHFPNASVRMTKEGPYRPEYIYTTYLAAAEVDAIAVDAHVAR